jgi:hypothetical protein
MAVKLINIEYRWNNRPYSLIQIRYKSADLQRLIPYAPNANHELMLI